MKAVVYCRVSDREQVERLSLGDQERTCRAYCEREGWEVARVFVERGVSAKTTERPELRSALDYCEKRKKALDYFVVYAVDRFAREQGDHHALRRILDGWGIQLRAATQEIREDAEGRFMEGMLAAAAQYDNDLRARRTKMGMMSAVRSGRWVWRPPLGYRVKRDPDTGRNLGIEPEPDVARLVRDAFLRISRGAQIVDVVEEMNDAGVRGGNGGEITRQTLSSVLGNPLYKGTIRVPKWGLEVDGNHHPLVDEMTFARVQRALGRKDGETRSYRKASPDFSLSGGFLSCMDCGRSLTGSWARSHTGKRYPYYRCYGCSGLNISRRKMDSLYADCLAELEIPEEEVDACMELVEDTFEKLSRTATDRTGRLMADRKAAADSRQRLIDAYVYDRALPLAEYRERLAEMDAKLTEIDASLADCDEVPQIGKVLSPVREILSGLSRLWLASDTPRRRRLQVATHPEGASTNGEEVATPTTNSVFRYLRGGYEGEDDVVAPNSRFANLARDILAMRRAAGDSLESERNRTP